MGGSGWSGDVGGAPWVISVTGVVLSGASVAYATAFLQGTVRSLRYRVTTEAVLAVLQLVVMLVFSIALVYAGYRLARSSYSSEQRWWTALWTVMGLSGVLAVVVLVQSNQMADGRPLPVQTMVEEIVLGASGGALVGLFTGLTNAQVRFQEEQVSLQRDTFEFMNEFLRHYVLNGMQAMRGYADLIRSADADQREHYAEQITERSEHITEVVTNLRRLAQSMSGNADLRAVNLSKILRDEIDSLATEYPNATFETDVPDDVHVVADPFLRTICQSLVLSAVKNAASENPHVEVSVEVTPDGVYFNVADNGPTAPLAAAGNLDDLEPQGEKADGRLGLYIAKQLVEKYGGRVTVLENHPQGTIVRSRLKRPS